MEYWAHQPIYVGDEVAVIEQNPVIKEIVLPEGFSFTDLSWKNTDVIHQLLTDHYIGDNILSIIYARDYIEWYLRRIPDGFAVGLTLTTKGEKTLVGFISCMFLEMTIDKTTHNVPYVNFLCINNKIRKLGLAPMMIQEIKRRFHAKGFLFGHFTAVRNIEKHFCKMEIISIPINFKRLQQVEFLNEKIPNLPVNVGEPLHLMKKSDIPDVVKGLNEQKFFIQPYFTLETAELYLLPKKNIVYSFVKRNDKGDVTDFVCFYKHYYYCKQKDMMLSIGFVSFYFHHTLSLTDLFVRLIEKLPSYHIDQLNMYNNLENEDIDVTKFVNDATLHHYFYNLCVPITSPRKVSFFVF